MLTCSSLATAKVSYMQKCLSVQYSIPQDYRLVVSDVTVLHVRAPMPTCTSYCRVGLVETQERVKLDSTSDASPPHKRLRVPLVART